MNKKTLRKEIANNGLASASVKVKRFVTKESVRMRRERKKAGLSR